MLGNTIAGGTKCCVFNNFIKTFLKTLEALTPPVSWRILYTDVTCVFQEVLNFIVSEVFVFAELPGKTTLTM